MLDIGKYKNRIVTFDDATGTNGHILVMGESGSGKTVQCQKLISSAVQQNATVIALDMHGALSDDQIFWKYKPIFEQYVHNINKKMEGIGCNLLTPVKYADGTMENVIDTIGSVTEVLAEAIKAGSRQRSELRKALEFLYENEEYEKYGFKSLDTALYNAGTKEAEILRDKLYFLTAHNVFVPENDFYIENKINIFRLSRYDLKTQQLIAEILLSYIWRLAMADKFKKSPVYIFLDECHNLPTGRNNTLAQFLAEGRRFGINLILATQIMEEGKTSIVQQRLTQCGVKLYFKPASSKVAMTAKMIDPNRVGEWSRLLRTLQVGEFITDGRFMVDGISRGEPLKISGYETKDALNDKSSKDEEIIKYQVLSN